ncbi:hypothetical protein B0A55_04771 [Friedmanniomyces simplex]|uniref:Mediator of RNA polymerase II transcription subunit 9 n=1 Tax=Friedmanniomyces simplex TaxID=329884 RepID=A0A4U0XJT6_9PEZI|nr:hypothetical protein B0A55_04771 [Friedmanniomyces simplex]
MAVTQATAPPRNSQHSHPPPPPPATSLTQQPALPPPQLFDILPALHEILAHIDHTSSDTVPPDDNDTDNDHEMGLNYTNLPPLDPKDLPTAILPLKAQMRRGLRELERLPDMERSVEEQVEEIAELEGRVGRQEVVIRGLAFERVM